MLYFKNRQVQGVIPQCDLNSYYLDLSKIVQSKMPHGWVVSNADAVPGHRQVTKTTRLPLKQDERAAGQVHEDVDRRRNGGKEEEEEADDSDEDNENTR